tara:strand:- start:2671 stop:2859 length:189 start_codon:yes stop_codon:yes gene_type:complete
LDIITTGVRNIMLTPYSNDNHIGGYMARGMKKRAKKKNMKKGTKKANKKTNKKKKGLLIMMG